MSEAKIQFVGNVDENGVMKIVNRAIFDKYIATFKGKRVSFGD